MARGVVITIDGPAGAGKSTVARALAQRLGYHFLDTGAMYRVVTLAAMQRGVAWDDTAALAQLAQDVSIELDGPHVALDGRDVSREIRTSEVTANIRHVADNAQVRKHLVALQRRLARQDNTVAEGRDQGTVAFPDAACKIFLTASSAERARRRRDDLRVQGEDVPLDEIVEQIDRRDRGDAARPVGALRPADDAIAVATDGLTIEQVVDRLAELVRTVVDTEKPEA